MIVDMLILNGDKLEDYKTNVLEIDSEWERRDFTKGVLNYFKSSTEKVLAVSGLRGTGKTVGILQAAQTLDVVYLLVQNGEKETGKDYVEFLKKTDKKYIIIDEYSWIKDREELDRYLLTSVQNNKRIVITATESITLEFLNYGALNHRVDVLHTTLFSYAEHLRVFGKTHSKNVCREYLIQGGLFQSYALKNFDSTKHYIEDAIVNNLAHYLRDEMSQEEAQTLTYSVLYLAICPSNLSSIPTLRANHVTLENFLEQMGVNTTLIPSENKLYRVADIFEQIGLIVRVPNFDETSERKEQYYITNPSMSSQLIMATYNLRELPDSILGHLYEASVMVQLSTNKLSEHDIYFYNNEKTGEVNNSKNHELDIIITDKEKEFAYFFECKFSKNDVLKLDITLLSGYLESNDFKDIEIVGRYVIYNGRPTVKEYDVGTVVFLPLCDAINRYFEFNENTKDILKTDTQVSIEGETGNYKQSLISKVRLAAQELKSDSEGNERKGRSNRDER